VVLPLPRGMAMAKRPPSSTACSILAMCHKLDRACRNMRDAVRLQELEQMQQRLLEGYLAGAVEKEPFTTRTAALKAEADRVREKLAAAQTTGAEVGEHVVEMWDFAQDAARRWMVSQTPARREILTRALLKRSLSATSLVTIKRKPFDMLAEGLSVETPRGDWT
jgi:hypothetical protein